MTVGGETGLEYGQACVARISATMYDFGIRNHQFDHADEPEVHRHLIDDESLGIGTFSEQADVLISSVGKIADICLMDAFGKPGIFNVLET